MSKNKPEIPATWGEGQGDRDKRIMVQGQPRQKHKTKSEKQIRGKRPKGMVQVVEHLPRKHEFLIQTSIPP
jgi:hypothetical protein